MKTLILFLFFIVGSQEPGARMIVADKEEAAVIVYKQSRVRPTATAELYELTIAPEGMSVIKVPIPTVTFGPPTPTGLPQP